MRSLSLGLVFAASLCATIAGAPASAQEKFTFIAVSPTSGYMLPMYVAMDQGFYKAAGLDFEIKTVGGDQNGIRALVTGVGQVTVVGAPILYEAVTNGAKVKGIGGGNQTLTDYYLVLGKGKGTTVKDAANKTLAISNPGSMYAFDYKRPSTLEEARNGLEGIAESKLLAGGMSIVPVMRYRLAQPSALIDLGKIAALKGVSEVDNTIRIGAMTTHYAVSRSELVRGKIPALAQLAGGIGDPLVRNRGTIGGSLAHNDPAACTSNHLRTASRQWLIRRSIPAVGE